MDNQTIREALEACRPSNDDLDAPELREVAERLDEDRRLRTAFQRSQRLDQRITRSIHDVPVPDGLLNRLVDQIVRPSAPLSSRVARVPGRWSRRWFLVIGGAAATAAALWVAFGLLIGTKGDLEADGLLEQAIRFYQDDAAGTGVLARRVAPPNDFPLNGIRTTPEMSWRRVQDFLGSATGCAYDLTGPRGLKATLYVVPVSVSSLPSVPPSQPTMSTGGAAGAAWQVGRLVYVLVAEGGTAEYQYFVVPPSAPLT